MRGFTLGELHAHVCFGEALVCLSEILVLEVKRLEAG